MAQVLRLQEGERRFPKKRSPRLNVEDGSKRIRNVFLVIRTMRSAESMVEQVISAHPTSMDALNKQKKEEADPLFKEGVEYRIVGLPVTRELTPFVSKRTSSSGELIHPLFYKKRDGSTTENNSKREDVGEEDEYGDNEEYPED